MNAQVTANTPELLDRMPPHDPEAERQVVGAVILDDQKLDAVPWLRPEHFRLLHYRILWQRMLLVHRETGSVDHVALVDGLRQHGELEKIGGVARLATTVGSLSQLRHVGHWARIIERHAQYRQLIATGVDLIASGYSASGEPREMLARAEARLAEIDSGPGDTEPVTAWDATLETLQQISQIVDRQQSAGVPTGMPAFDQAFGGLFPGELVILASRPAVGKSSLGMQIAFYNARRGRAVYVATMEMTRAEVITRELCAEAGVSTQTIRTGQVKPEHQTRLVEVSGDVSRARLWLHDHSALTVYDIRRAARRLLKDHLILIVVDYLQLIRPENRRDPREQQVAAIGRALKALAVELRVPVLCLCQLSREAAKANKPQLNHLRESGALEQDANAVWFLHRTDAQTGDTTLIVAKNRNGEVGEGSLVWMPESTRYRCAEDFPE